MAGGKRLDRRGSGPVWFLILALVVFALYSGMIAWGTANDCGKGADKSWQVFPPAWECKGRLPGYG